MADSNLGSTKLKFERMFTLDKISKQLGSFYKLIAYTLLNIIFPCSSAQTTLVHCFKTVTINSMHLNSNGLSMKLDEIASDFEFSPQPLLPMADP